MSGSTYRPISRYPGLLGARIAQADQLARALQGLSGESVPSDASYLWLLGRADEVRTFVDEILREWSERLIDTPSACDAIRSYVDAIHVALHRRYGGYGASCCGPHLEPPHFEPGTGTRSAVEPCPSPRGGVDPDAAPPSGVQPGMRQRLKSGVLEVEALGRVGSRARSRARGSVDAPRRPASVPPRRKQAG